MKMKTATKKYLNTKYDIMFNKTNTLINRNLIFLNNFIEFNE